MRIICCALQRPPFFAASILIIEFSADTVRSRRAKLQDTIEFLQNDACTKNNAKSASSPQSDKDQEAIGASDNRSILVEEEGEFTAVAACIASGVARYYLLYDHVVLEGKVIVVISNY